jgi:hypothetical protein
MAKLGGFIVDAPARAFKTIVSAPGYGLNQGAAPAQVPIGNEGRRTAQPAMNSASQISAAQVEAPAQPTQQQPQLQPQVQEKPGVDVGHGIRRIDTPGAAPLYTAENPSPVRGQVSVQQPTQQPTQQARGRVPVVMPTLGTGGGVFSSMASFANQAGNALGAVAQNRAMNQADKASREDSRLGLDAMRLGDEMQNSASRRAAIGVDMERAGMDMEKAKQIDAARQEYLAAGDDPAKQKAAARKLAVLSGRDSQQSGEWGLHVTPATKNVDGTTNEGSIYRFNKATGQAERVDVGRQATTSQQGTPLVKGEAYPRTMNGVTANYEYMGDGKWNPAPLK